MTSRVQVERIHRLNSQPIGPGPVVYWMSRDQRAEDNWALLFAQDTARAHGQPLVVVFSLVPTFLAATLRQYGFMLDGLRETEDALRERGIPFVLVQGETAEVLPRWVGQQGIGAVVTDFSPLRIGRQWRQAVAAAVPCAMFEVDAHNVVPCRTASDHREFGAYTLRPKIHRRLEEFLTPFPALERQDEPWIGGTAAIDWPAVEAGLQVDRSVPRLDWCVPGARAGELALRRFIERRLGGYAVDRNDPTKEGQSDLSPYLHYGQLSAQRIALTVQREASEARLSDVYIEELIVRRELADNFCLYTPEYDQVAAFPDWAQKTHAAHRDDRREHTYTDEQFDLGQTHDPLWNAAQHQLTRHGKMHNYLRMYWAKKILEWTPNVVEAMRVAIWLNDRYEIDGRDPNGYTGIAWSLGGVHDRAWGERPIFGKIRYMSLNGAKGKFDAKAYIARWDGEATLPERQETLV